MSTDVVAGCSRQQHRYIRVNNFDQDLIQVMLRLYIKTGMYYHYRGSTVVKVLCYKSEGRWFDPSWCQWIFH